MGDLIYQKPELLTRSLSVESLVDSRAYTFAPDELDNAQLVVQAFVGAKLTQPQFDALVVLVLFVGAQTFAHSKLRDWLNTFEYRAAANQFLLLRSSFALNANTDLKYRVQERALFLLGTL